MLGSDFPIGDGGLFLTMIRDLQHAGFVLPTSTSYNADQLPFAYPPLAIYIAAALNHAGLDLIGLMRFLPALFSVMTIPLVYLVSLELTDRKSIASVAAIAFALAPRSYEWLIAGGGLTRAPGLTFALLGVWLGIRLIHRPSLSRVLSTGLAGGLTLMTHPEASVFLALSLGLVLLAQGRSWRVAGGLLLAGSVAILVASPWWITILARDGLGALVGAAGSRWTLLGISLRDLLFGQFTGAEAFDIFLGVGFVGLLADLGRGRFLLPAWVLASTIVIVGAGLTYAMVPWSLLTAIGVVDVIVPGVDRLSRGHRFARPVLLAGLLGASMLASLATVYSMGAPVHGLLPADREAMAWVSRELPQDARVAVVTGLPWWIDAPAEWFPALAQRQSVTTPQGYEWTDQLSVRLERDELLQTYCAQGTVACLKQWAQELDVQAEYVFIPKGKLVGPASAPDCCSALRNSVRSELEVVYDGPGATIARFP